MIILIEIGKKKRKTLEISEQKQVNVRKASTKKKKCSKHAYWWLLKAISLKQAEDVDFWKYHHTRIPQI